MSYIRYDSPPSLFSITASPKAPNFSMAQTPPSLAPMDSQQENAAPASATPAFSPLYRQIKELILQSLQAGEWKPAEVIPSEMDLAARFRVSHGTVRKAIDELASVNLLVRRFPAGCPSGRVKGASGPWRG